MQNLILANYDVIERHKIEKSVLGTCILVQVLTPGFGRTERRESTG